MNNSDKTLLFISYQYPYLTGEYFIEEEMKYLSKAFKKVIVFPTRCLFWKPTEIRDMPDGVELWDPRDLPLVLRFLWGVYAVLLAPYWIKQQQYQWQGHKHIPAVSYSNALKSAIKSLMIARALRWFNRKSNSLDGGVGYSYWRDPGAAGLALTRDYLGLWKIYTRCHRIDIYSPLFWPTETLIHARFDGVFSVSTDGKHFLEGVKGLPSEKMEVHRLGVRIPEKCSVASSDGIYRVVSCSNLIPVKRVELIALVISQLPFPVEWTHIGDGPSRDALEELVAGFDTMHCVKLKGRLSNQQVYEYYESNPVDLFINLSESEGVPVSIMEALAHGIPVVATDVGGTAEIIDDVVGKLVPLDVDYDQVSQRIVQLRDLEHSGVNVRSSARLRADQTCSAYKNYTEFCLRLLED